uniref:Tumor necrosis factor n=1 Tax=Pinctada imbricata TaxID=66713 RepID=A0AAU6R4E0_PINIB
MANIKGNIKTCKCLSIGLVFTNIVLLLCTFAITLAWFLQRQKFEPKEHSLLTCLPSASDSKDCFSRVDDLCCSNLTLSDSIKHNTKKRYEEQTNEENTHLAQHCLSSPGNITAARVVGIDKDIAPTAILQWRQNNHGGFLNEVKYLSGRFVIEKNGYYFIYSQVTFIEHSVNEHDKLSHSIYRQTPLNNEKLVESVRSHCRLQTGESDSSRFVGSVFLLNKGDEIYVHVTDPTKVSRAEHANYFGLHII